MTAAHAGAGAWGREAALRFAWAALVVSCFLLARPYLGIVHDAIQYAAQALARGDPEVYRNDIYFRWGSQDRYTLFSPLFAWLAAPLGLGPAHLALVVAGLALFLAASFALVRALVPEGLRGFAMLLIATSAGNYGPERIFRMGEAFVSPRPLAEAGTLAALVLLASGRRAWALGVLGACALLHPLVGLAGLLFWGCHAALSGVSRPLLVALALAPVAAALAGLGPAAQLFQTFDAEWFAKVYEMNRHLFLTHWGISAWASLAVDLAVLHLAGRLAGEPARRFFQAAQLAALVALGATLAGADLLHNVLVTNLQPWRVLWIVHWLALAGLPIVAARMWSEGEAGRLVVGLLLFAFVTRGLPTSLGAALLAAALFAARAQLRPDARLVRAVLCALAAGALASWVAAEWRLLTSPFMPVDSAEVPPLRALSRALPLFVLGAAFVRFGLARAPGRVATIAAAALLVAALALWDQRPPFARYVDSAEPGAHPFSRIVAPGQQVWWHGESLAAGRSLIMPWIVMKRASYQSAFQHVGQHFSRDVTMELARRDEKTLPFAFQASLCADVVSIINPGESCQPEFDAAQELCREAPELDYLVLETDYPGKWIARWSPPAEVNGRVPRYHLYACNRLVAR